MPLNKLNNLFGKSPFLAIQDHMLQVHACAEALYPFYIAARDDDWVAAEQCYNKIVELENAADALKKNLRLTLPNNFFLPVPRSDLLELISIQDRIANLSKDISGLMLGRKMTIPEAISEDMGHFVSQAIAASGQAMKAIEELDELLEAGFRGREAALVENLIEELDRIEHDTDRLQISIRGKVYQFEEELPPVDVMFLYQIIQWVGELADKAQKVGSRLQILIAR